MKSRRGGKKTRNENERRGKQVVWQAKREKVRSGGLVCDAGEQAGPYVCKYLRRVALTARVLAVDMVEVQHVPAGAYVLYVSCLACPQLQCSAPVSAPVPLLPASSYGEYLLGRQLGPSNRDRVAASSRPGSRTQRCWQSTECRVQSAGCRMQTVQRSIVSDGRFDRLEVPEWAARGLTVLIKVRGRGCGGCGCICSRGRGRCPLLCLGLLV